jgi:LysM repeat protein
VIAFTLTRRILLMKKHMRHPKMYLQNESKTIKITVPYAPQSVQMSGLAATYQNADRPGRTPLVLRSGLPLPVMTMELTIAAKDHQTSVENILALFRNLAASTERVQVTLGPSEGGLWRLTTMDVNSTMRAHGSNQITRATVNVTFTRASDPATNVGPLSGGAKPPNTVSTKPTTAVRPKPIGTSRIYTVKKGDSLWIIAHKYYKDGSEWPTIARANKLRNPNLIYPGQRLKIP